MPPLFSIVVPTYNRADLIAKTIQSLTIQSHTDYEIIIIDDGSTDDTAEVLRPFLSEKVSYHKKNNGERAAARNYGAAMARGRYVNFFDSDDIALPNHIAVASDMAKQHADPEWFHLGYEWADPDGTVFKKVNSFRGETLNKQMSQGNPLSCNGVFIRRDIILQNPFNENRELSASEDYELWCRLAARFPLYYSNEITSRVVDHEMRSVRTINGDKLIRRLELLIENLSADAQVISYFGKAFRTIKMDSNSYIALHLANVPKYKMKSVFYLFKALCNSSQLLRTKRLYATVKNIIIKW
jgi:glycosyltransferase involved in cell wall biosynthesis